MGANITRRQARDTKSFMRGRVTALFGLVVLCVACSNESGPYGPYYGYGTCDSDRNCPAGTYCVEPAPGACLYSCQRDSECGPGYACKSLDSRGAEGKVSVCSPR